MKRARLAITLSLLLLWHTAAYCGTARNLEPNGTTFSTPVTATLTYTGTDTIYMDQSTLQAAYWTGTEYSTAGIVSNPPNTADKTVTFTTTHFTLFTLIGQPGPPVRSMTPWGIGAGIVVIIAVAVWTFQKKRTSCGCQKTPSATETRDDMKRASSEK